MIEGLGDGVPLSPLRLQNAAEQIAERLVTAIALGEFVPGQRLPAERELAGMLEVSRSTVREALQRLVATGYVKIHRGRNGGAVVQADWGPGTAEMVERTLAPNWEYFELLFDLRRLIEQQIARTAAERLENEHVADIEAARDRYRDAGSDREASRVADRELHAAIARATKNPLLGNLSRQLRAQISLGFEAEPYSAEIRERAIEQHDRARARGRRAPARGRGRAGRGALLAHRGRHQKAAREGAPVSPRMRYILERILLTIPTLLAMSVFVFLLIRLVPGDPVQTMLGFRATPQNVATIRHQLHLDEPLITQYREWLSGLLHGDLGRDYVSHAPLSELLRSAIPVTLELTLLSMGLALVAGVPLGVLGAQGPGLAPASDGRLRDRRRERSRLLARHAARAALLGDPRLAPAVGLHAVHGRPAREPALHDPPGATLAIGRGGLHLAHDPGRRWTRRSVRRS